MKFIQKIKERVNVRRYSFILFIISLLVSISPAMAYTITPDYVEASGYNSASGGYYWVSHASFENMCPFCSRSNVLLPNPKGVPEFEWSCKHCDSDFSVNGRCKGSYSWQRNVWLTEYAKPEPVPIEQSPYVPPSKTDYVKLKLKEPILGSV